MPQNKSKKRGGAGDPDVVKRRNLVRQLNRMLEEGSSARKKLDGRSEKRRKRLIEELKKGKKGKPLKPVDRVAHVHELLELGETLTSLRKQGVKFTRPQWTEETLAFAERVQAELGYRPEAWRILGLVFDGGKAKEAPKGGRPRKSGGTNERT